MHRYREYCRQVIGVPATEAVVYLMRERDTAPCAELWDALAG